MDSVGFAGPRQLPFVRPDVPPVSDDKLKRRQDSEAEATAEASFKARPQFRSALEQVSSICCSSARACLADGSVGELLNMRVKHALTALLCLALCYVPYVLEHLLWTPLLLFFSYLSFVVKVEPDYQQSWAGL